MDEMNTSPAPQHSSNAGALIGAGVIVALLVLGALYFWMDAREAQAPSDQDQRAVENSQEDARAAALSQTNSSDATADIASDLEATDLGDVEGEMNATGDGL